MKGITRRQQKLLAFIEKYQWKNGGSPTIKEMREYLEVASDNGILKHLAALQKKGCLKMTGKARGIKQLPTIKQRIKDLEALEEEGSAATSIGMLTLPLLGAVPAGGPVITEENTLDTFEIGKGLMKAKSGSFLLRVTGNSMINAGIHEGDMVLVSPEQKPRSGDIVVALVDGENTVKRYMSEGGHLYLKAENPEYKNIVPERELRIQGVVTGLIRNY